MLRFALPIALVAAYGASPYLSLYEMGQAVRQGDARALCADIDWDHVRDGLKEDIADGITGEPAPTEATVTAPSNSQNNPDDLPPFGSGFVSNMAGNVVDRTVTPAHLAETMGALRAAGAKAPRPALEAAYFTSPTSFTVAFRPANTTDPVRLRLDLQRTQDGLRWKVTRAWIPETMLEKSETHTS